MEAARRQRLSPQQRAELWRRWKEGQSQSEIGRALGRAQCTIFGLVIAQGGIAPRVRSRSSRVLTLSDREEISRGICRDDSIRCIADRIGRAASSVWREIARNGGRAQYRATTADLRAWRTARRPKACKLQTQRRLQRVVAQKLGLDWSPEQIAGWLRQTYPDDSTMQVSHETIYRTLFVQARGVLKKELVRHLRSRRLMRRPRKTTTKGPFHERIADAVSIRQRPPEVEDRAVPGHWEGDLLAGAKNTHIATVVERQTRFTKLVKVQGKDTASVVCALTRQVRTLPAELRRTLTWDRGLELARHKAFSIATDVKVYFCDPSSPWQRGTNENTNGLLRQYFPKGSDLSEYTQRQLNQIAKRLNQRPRKTLGFKSPAETLHALVASTG
jgi:transposase, IS30 family